MTELRDLVITEPVLFPVAEPCRACGRTVQVEEDACAWCTARESYGTEPTDRVKKDPEWNRRADLFLSSLYVGVHFTADDLIDECGLPTGSLNQVGSKFRAWAKAGRISMEGTRTSTRKATHGRLIRHWKVLG